jgi:2-amino-4-hydroxy-6-hydroxymethyldihydropteridine diphosphokinase
MHERAFVLVPLAELAPDLLLPDGRTVEDALRAIVRSSTQRAT